MCICRPTCTCMCMQCTYVHCFSLAAGVRQGVLSPLLFAIFIAIGPTVVEMVETVNAGCYINCIYLQYFSLGYADDVLLLAPTISGLT